jgi:hypothetical protein
MFHPVPMSTSGASVPNRVNPGLTKMKPST